MMQKVAAQRSPTPHSPVIQRSGKAGRAGTYTGPPASCFECSPERCSAVSDRREKYFSSGRGACYVLPAAWSAGWSVPGTYEALRSNVFFVLAHKAPRAARVTYGDFERPAMASKADSKKSRDLSLPSTIMTGAAVITRQSVSGHGIFVVATKETEFIACFAYYYQ